MDEAHANAKTGLKKIEIPNCLSEIADKYRIAQIIADASYWKRLKNSQISFSVLFLCITSIPLLPILFIQKSLLTICLMIAFYVAFIAFLVYKYRSLNRKHLEAVETVNNEKAKQCAKFVFLAESYNDIIDRAENLYKLLRFDIDKSRLSSMMRIYDVLNEVHMILHHENIGGIEFFYIDDLYRSIKDDLDIFGLDNVIIA
ncbi:MAG: hypothetical protein WC663_00515 [Patescibacteria group bacterium]|jgi:Ca2+/Na+ antiporter